MQPYRNFRLRRTILLFTLGLTVQAIIFILAIPAKAQIEPPAQICDPVCATVLIDSVANVAPFDSYTVTYRADFQNPISDTFWAGDLFDDNASFLSVKSNQGKLSLGDVSYTVTTGALVSPFLITATTQVQESPVIQDLTLVLSDTAFAKWRTDALVRPDLPFQLGYRYPGLIPAGILTNTYRFTPRGVITGTLVVTGEILQGGGYRSLVSQGLDCPQMSVSAFLCTGLLGPEAFVTPTIDAFDPGTVQSLLSVAAGEKTLTYTFTTTVQPPPAPILSVHIDIKPASEPNSINPTSRGNIPVAIFSTPDFDAVGAVDPLSLAFGPTGQEHSLRSCNQEDINFDGLPDLICRFDTLSAGFQLGDVLGVLTGQTFSGTPFEGVDSVRILAKED